VVSVFVCEDNPRYCQFVSECIKNRLMLDRVEMELVLSTSDPAEIIERIRSKNIYGLYFLDIELGDGLNGLDLAQQIREHDPNGAIVFITSHSQYLPLTFKHKVEALDYVQKGNDEEVQKHIIECIERVSKKQVARDEKRYHFKIPNGGEDSCRYDDILFFEADPSVPHRIILHTKRLTYAHYQRLEKLEKELPASFFFKCHRSYIVNLTNLTETCKHELVQGKNGVTMPNGAVCKVSAGNKKALIKYMEVSLGMKK